jgi:hypothetical protein
MMQIEQAVPMAMIRSRVRRPLASKLTAEQPT